MVNITGKADCRKKCGTKECNVKSCDIFKLYHEYHGTLFAIIRSIVRNKKDAEDICNDIFINLVPDCIDGTTKVSAKHLLQLGRYRAIDFYRMQMRNAKTHNEFENSTNSDSWSDADFEFFDEEPILSNSEKVKKIYRAYCKKVKSNKLVYFVLKEKAKGHSYEQIRKRAIKKGLVNRDCSITKLTKIFLKHKGNMLKSLED